MLTIAYQTLSNVESIKGSDPEGSVDFFLPSEMLVFYCPNLSEVLLLNACLAVSSWSLFVPSFLFISGNPQSSRKDCLATASDTRRIFVAVFCYFCLVKNKVSGYFFLDFRRAYPDDRLSLFSVRREILIQR